MLKKMLDKQLNNIIQITFSCDLVNWKAGVIS
jgi:hypothetical protein